MVLPPILMSYFLAPIILVMAEIKARKICICHVLLSDKYIINQIMTGKRIKATITRIAHVTLLVSSFL